jgi:hypothetical protein
VVRAQILQNCLSKIVEETDTSTTVDARGGGLVNQNRLDLKNSEA